MQISQALFGGEQLYPPPNKYTKTSSITFINTNNNSKFKSSMRALFTVLINTNRNNKSKISIIRTVLINTNRNNKSKISLLRTVQSNLVYKLSYNFFHLISINILQSRLISQSKVKNSVIRTLQTLLYRQSKEKISNIKVVDISNVRQIKQKDSNLLITNVFSTRLLKSKNTLLKIIDIFSASTSKKKNTTVKTIQINNSKTSKIKEIVMEVILLFSTKINKSRTSNLKATQVVSATVIKAPSKKITSGITYTIGMSKGATLYRQFKAISIRALSNPKIINKNTIASSINSQSLSYYKIWRFVLYVITKITSFNQQLINRPNYGIPAPDVRDPNMLDTSNPGVEGLVDGEPEDDSFIE